MTTRRVVVPVPAGADTGTVGEEALEQAVAVLLELAPGGVEERASTALEGGIELIAYGSDDELHRIADAFPGARFEEVTPGWEDAWRDFHHGVEVGGLWIGPPWESPPAGLRRVVIDPGRAFGTGAHATTRLCIELLARTPRGSLLDIGCGSGVLAIAAARLGFSPLTAVDNDPLAVEITHANAAVNGVTVTATLRDGLNGDLPRADVAVANVLLEPVTTILSRLDAGHVITSGYLAGESPPAPGWRRLDRLERDGWAADLFAR